MNFCRGCRAERQRPTRRPRSARNASAMCRSRRAAARSVRQFSLKLPHADGETCCSRHAVAMIDATMARRAVSEIEIYRAANLLIQRHGRDAAVEAARLVDLTLDRGGMKGRHQ